MHIVLDSTVFYDDPSLTGESWRLVREYMRRSGASVLVPQVVLEEVMVKASERFRNAQGKIAAGVREVRKLTGTQVEIPEAKLEQELERYRPRLDARLRELNVRVLPFPAVTHKKLVARDLGRRKPFSSTGKGYRDALIWYSLLEHLKQNPEDSVLITGNSSDFCTRKDNPRLLHEDLVSDLKDADIDVTVHVCPKLDDFVDNFVKPTLKKLEDFKLALQEKKPFDLEQFIKTNFDEVFEGLQRVDMRIGVPGVNLEEPFGITELGEPSEVDIMDVFELSEAEVYIEFEATYDAVIFAFLWKSDVYLLDEDSDVSVTDWEWTKHYAQVETSVNLRVQFRLIYDRDKKEATKLEVRGAETPSRDY